MQGSFCVCAQPMRDNRHQEDFKDSKCQIIAQESDQITMSGTLPIDRSVTEGHCQHGGPD